MSDEEFSRRLKAAGVRHGYWAHHPRPWKLCGDGPHGLRVVRDANGGIVTSSFGVGFSEFWEAYLVATGEAMS